MPLYKKIVFNNNDVFYRDEGKYVTVASSLIPFSEYDKSIIEYFFSEFPKLSFIKFERAAQTENECILSKIIKLKHFDNNFCLELPESIEEYKSSLGKKTRMHLGQYLRHTEKELNENGGGYYTAPLTEENRSLMEKLVDLNHERCESKGFQSGAEKEKIFNLLKEYGVLNYLKLGDEIIAGTIGSIYNNQFCLHLIAHSNDYSKLNPGNCILYKTIEYAISKKIPVFNFLWGNCEYKSRFGAKEIQLFDYYVYRKYSNYFIQKIKIFLKKMIKNAKSGLKFIFRPSYHMVKRLIRSFIK